MLSDKGYAVCSECKMLFSIEDGLFYITGAGTSHAIREFVCERCDNNEWDFAHTEARG